MPVPPEPRSRTEVRPLQKQSRRAGPFEYLGMNKPRPCMSPGQECRTEARKGRSSAHDDGKRGRAG